MSRALKLALIIALSVAIMIVLIAVGKGYGKPAGNFGYVLRIDLPQSEQEIGLPKLHGPSDASRPLVVIDPGHGGHDPGAGQKGIKEKHVTLAIAQAIRDSLVESGGVRVALTREEDRYLTLKERSVLARRLNADLFLSIHADSVEQESVRGASVYVLSEKGSSEAASRIAAQENGADVVNGVALNSKNEVVNAILLDLSQTEARASSIIVAGLFLRELRGKTRLHNNTVQSAAFAVLKAPDVPSILLETGYISSPEDAEYLSSPKGQKIISTAGALAVRAYFARQQGI